MKFFKRLRIRLIEKRLNKINKQVHNLQLEKKKQLMKLNKLLC